MDFNKAQNMIGLRVLNDNVIWLWVKDKSVVVIDPSVHEPVIRYIEENNFHLKAVLQTHHHSDHIGGTKHLIERWPNVKVIASSKEKKRIPFQNVSVEDGETLNILGEEVKIIEVLGHTSSHIAFFLNGKNPVLFIGDTLFSGGCGRIFEGSYEQMYNSLRVLKNLDKDTKIYCGHEYTLKNSEFCLAQDSNNNELLNKIKEIKEKIKQGKTSMPSTIGEELNCNIFLKSNDLENFKKLRDLKDNF